VGTIVPAQEPKRRDPVTLDHIADLLEQALEQQARILEQHGKAEERGTQQFYVGLFAGGVMNLLTGWLQGKTGLSK
jgi:hypothetical protein